MSQLSFISHALYNLKKRYGHPVKIITVNPGTVDLDTGQRLTVKSAYTVQRMIVLPAELERQFSYSLPVIASAKNFTYGGRFDVNLRRFIVDAKDLQGPLEINQYFIYDGFRYDLRHISRFEDSRAYVVVARQEIAVGPGEVTEITVNQSLETYDGPESA